MAIAVIGGLITSTALSLLVVPVVFTVVAGVERRLRRLLNRPAKVTAGGMRAAEGEQVAVADRLR